MSAHETLDRVIATVDRAIPEHRRGVIEPPDILRSGKANCFGRLALYAGGLLAEGTMPVDDLSLFISLNHGMPAVPGGTEQWFGHCILGLPGEAVVDVANEKGMLRMKSSLGIETGVTPLIAVDLTVAKLDAQLQKLGVALPPLSSDRPDSQRAYYMALPLTEGVEAYQQMNLSLHKGGNLWTMADYSEAYNALPNLTTAVF